MMSWPMIEWPEHREGREPVKVALLCGGPRGGLIERVTEFHPELKVPVFRDDPTYRSRLFAPDETIVDNSYIVHRYVFIHKESDRNGDELGYYRHLKNKEPFQVEGVL